MSFAEELMLRSMPTTALRLARVQGGDANWRGSVREFTRFADDIDFAQECGQISHVNERFLGWPCKSEFCAQVTSLL